MHPFFIRLLVITGISLGVMSFSGCSTKAREMQNLPTLYAKGEIKTTEKIAVNLAKESGSTQNYKQQTSSVWYLLCAALSAHAASDFTPAVSFYDQSLTAIDFYKQNSSLENLQTLLFDDRQAGYSGDTFEQLLTRVYFSLALDHQGKFYDATALLKQHEQALQLAQESLKRIGFLNHIQVASNPLAKYLLACHLEQQGDLSNARILFEQAQKLTVASFIKNDLEQLGKRKEKAWLIVVMHKGLVPNKVNSYSVGATASMTALETYMQTRYIDPAWSTLSGLAVPAYQKRRWGIGPEIHLQVDGLSVEKSRFFDVSQVAQSELNQRLPVIAARSLARQLLRQASILGLTRPSKEHPSAGMTSDLILLIANAHTRADTRSWMLLPASILCSRVDLEPGEHLLFIESQMKEGPMMQSRHEKRVRLKPGVNIVELFAPRASWVVMGDKLQVTPQTHAKEIP